jgi:hypothetical protein
LYNIISLPIELIITVVTFTAGSCYEPLVKMGMIITAGFGDGRSIFTAVLYYEPAMKITFTNGLTCAAT